MCLSADLHCPMHGERGTLILARHLMGSGCDGIGIREDAKRSQDLQPPVRMELALTGRPPLSSDGTGDDVSASRSKLGSGCCPR